MVPWNSSENKFICPCHGSQYDPEGAVAHVAVVGERVLLSPWNENDPRTGEQSWWS